MHEDFEWRYDNPNLGLRFSRSDTFSLDSLVLDLGGYSCATPVEVRSSKGGFKLVEPEPAGPNEATCLQYTAAGQSVFPYWWKLTLDKEVTFSGDAWHDIQWFSVMFTNAIGAGPNLPRAKLASASIDSVAFVPEPSLALLGLTAAVAYRYHRRRKPTRH
jgi:hypothetical protein